MKLPTEIRLAIAELALTYEHGLIWHWKSETPGHRIGHFVVRQIKRNKYETHCDDPLTSMCISRQLRKETSNLWLKTAVLYFDGQDAPDPDSPPDGVWNPRCRRAVCAYEFFTTHQRTQQLPCLPPMILNPIYFGALPSVVRQLLDITQDPRLSDTRVVTPCAYAGEEAVRHSMKMYAKQVFLSRDSMHWADGLGVKRNWRIWPDPEFAKWIEDIREEISEQQYAASIDCIENGI